MRTVQSTFAGVFVAGVIATVGAYASAMTGPRESPERFAPAATPEIGTEPSAETVPSSEALATIALLLPDSDSDRYQIYDRPAFESQVADKCPGCEVVYFNAASAVEQEEQARAALNNEVDVLVLGPVDDAAAGAIVNVADESGVPVISYDRLILDVEGIDLYVSYDVARVGELQATTLIEGLANNGISEGDIVVLNGPGGDDASALRAAAAREVFDESGFAIGAQSDTTDGQSSTARADMTEHVETIGAANIIGVYAATDAIAEGAISALEDAGIDPLPLVTGQDADLAAIRRIVAGQQFMTVYKPPMAQARIAADAAIALVEGDDVPQINGDVDNGAQLVPSILLEPVAVTAENVADTVVADGDLTVEDICTTDVAEACATLGLT